jgi:hypothetical protein
MSVFRKLAVATAAVVAVGLVPAGSAEAAHASRVCVPVRARGVGQDLGGGQTTATIFSHGVKLGTTHAAFKVTGQSGSTVSFVGPIVFTASPGTLTAQVAGTLDLETGVFRSTSTSITGTGLLAPVSGRLTFRGTENLTDLTFTEAIRGRLCVDLDR